MKPKLTYKSLLAFSEENQKQFYTEFSSGVNIVHGRNTSGKSTLFLAILYTFGINDGNQYLSELLEEKVIFRLEILVQRNDLIEEIVIIRDMDTIHIKDGKQFIKKFNGISGNKAVEHAKLKEFLGEMFDFDLQLESKNEYKPAPIETMFLPYYISQAVGWVYLRKSFANLDYYKNFKEDYFDYYLGLQSTVDRVKKHQLEAQKNEKTFQISLIEKFEKQNDDLQLTKLVDEKFVEKSQQYVKTYTEKHKKLADDEKMYLLKSNELEFLQERLNVLIRVSNSHRKQRPEHGNCPTCSQSLPFGLAESYIYIQEENDTKKEITLIRAKIKDVQGEVNSLQNSTTEDRSIIAKEYSTLNNYVEHEVSFDTWLKNKANIELIEDLKTRIGSLTFERSEIEEELKGFKNDTEIEKARKGKSAVFESIFLSYVEELKAKELKEDRYKKLYDISAFPSQGVELHKTVMAYHFAFNKILKDSDAAHRFPFMLDAIFKEDLDEDNKKAILTFINKNKPTDTQMLFSLAQTKGQPSNANAYNKAFFAGVAKTIEIGDGVSERAFLKKNENPPKSIVGLINNTINIITGVDEIGDSAL